MRRAKAGLVLTLIGAVLAAAGCGSGQTAPPAAAESFVFENPLGDGVPEEWARYRLLDGKKWTIILRETNPMSHVYQVEEILRDPDANLEISREVRVYHPNHFLRGYDTAGMVVTRIYPERIFVAGRDWDCLCVEFMGRMQGVVRCWFSNDVPVVGLVKQVKVDGQEGVVNAELEDWSTR